MKKAILSLASLVLLTLTIPSQLRADTVLTTINVGGSSAGIAANPVTNKIYVGVNQTVVVIDGKTQQITARIDTGGGVGFVSVNVLTDRIYASSCNSGTCNIAVINGRTNTIVANIPTVSNTFLGIQGMGLNPVTNRIYASAADDQQLITIDGNTNTVIAQVLVPSQPGGISVNPKTNRIYVAGTGFPGLIMVFDGATNTQIASIPEDFGVNNTAVNFLLDRAYATDSDKVIVVDGATNQEAARVPAGPFATFIDVNLLNSKVYVVNAGNGSVSIIDGKTNQVVQTLPIPGSIFLDGIAVNLANGLTYVTDADTNQVTVLQP
jgi:YVTN family beta-propeller protein